MDPNSCRNDISNSSYSSNWTKILKKTRMTETETETERSSVAIVCAQCKRTFTPFLLLYVVVKLNYSTRHKDIEIHLDY